MVPGRNSSLSTQKKKTPTEELDRGAELTKIPFFVSTREKGTAYYPEGEFLKKSSITGDRRKCATVGE